MKKILEILKNPIFYLCLILAVAFGVRLFKIDNPIADWHSWRQADTAAVARNFYKLGFTPFTPIFDDMSGVSDPPIINPGRFRFVEFPIYPSLVYFGYLLAGGVDEKVARLVSILFSLGSVIFIYLIAKKYFGLATGLLSAAIFAFLPYNIYYSRVILPEPSLIFFCLGMFFFLDRWIRTNQGLAWSFLFLVCAFLTKPMAIFYLLPLIYSYYQKEGRLWPIPKKYFILILGFIPFVLWRFWIAQHPEGIPASNWLLNGNGIRFKPVFWEWIFQDRLGREILTVFGSVLFFIGLLFKPNFKEGWLLHLLAFSSILYLIIIATGNVQHDYYQSLIVPALAIFTARGFIILYQGIPNLVGRIFTIPLAILFLIMMFYSGWNQVKGLYQINNPVIVEAGKAADKILPKDALIVAPYNGDTSFLYQTNRAGLPFIPTSLENIRDKYGIRFLVSVAKDNDTLYAMGHYKILINTDKYVIVDLTQPK